MMCYEKNYFLSIINKIFFCFVNKESIINLITYFIKRIYIILI